MFHFQEEDRHLCAGHELIGTKVAVAASGGDSILFERSNPGFCKTPGDVIELEPCQRRMIGCAMQGFFQNDCDVCPRDGRGGTVTWGGIASDDQPHGMDYFNRLPGPVINWDIQKSLPKRLG